MLSHTGLLPRRAVHVAEPLESRVLLATITVNDAGDDANRDARLTLREAIMLANGELFYVGLTQAEQAQLSGPPSPDSNNIHFDILGGDVQRIEPIAALPPIVRPVVIDGYTQPGASPNTAAEGSNAIIAIQLRQRAGFEGLVILAGNSTVRGLSIVEFDNVARSLQAGIRIEGGGNNRIVGNFIGVRPDGTARGNTIGIYIHDSNVNEIGGDAVADRNVISGNQVNGIRLYKAHGNLILNNYIGTDPAGQRPVPNGDNGIVLDDSTENIVGEAHPARRNVISGNGSNGIFLIVARNNRIVANFIGINLDGIPIPNRGSGVLMVASSGNRVGSADPARDNSEANAIVRNGDAGVYVALESSTGNSIRGNVIFDNQDLGIDLAVDRPPPFQQDGPTENDPDDDLDRGGNALQNFPVITAVDRLPGGMKRVRGRLDSLPSTRYLIDLYGNSRADPSGYGEGETYLTTVEVTTNANGVAFFDVNVPNHPPHLSSTATNASTGDTSEFSPIFESREVLLDILEVGSAADTGPGSLREQVALANATPGPQTIVFNLPGDGPQTTNLASPLVITDTLLIDGYSQRGSVRNTNATGAVNAQVMVRLVGTGGFDGLVFTDTADRSGVWGLALSGFLTAITVNGAQGVTVGGSVVGAPAGGAGNISGVLLRDSAGSLVGTGHPFDRNILSGNATSGVAIEGVGSIGNLVSSNLIGTNAAGAAAGGEQAGGVIISGGATANSIGPGNLISGNSVLGVGLLSGGNSVFDNGIGVDVTGNTAVGNGDTGSLDAGVLVLGALGNVIDGNRISGNRADGVLIAPGTGALPPAPNNQVRGNTIGLNVAGSAPLANTGNGIVFQLPTDILNNTVGGNSADGIRGAGSPSGALSDFQISRNTVGLDATGALAVGNGGDGIDVSYAQDVLIWDNSIAASGTDGVFVFSATRVDMSGNYIGTNTAGAADLGNSSAGARWQRVTQSTAAGNQVGGNGGGISLDFDSSGNTLTRNLIGFIARIDAAATAGAPVGDVDVTRDPLHLIRRITGADSDDLIDFSPAPNFNYGLLVGGNDNQIIYNAVADSRHPNPIFPPAVGVEVDGDRNNFFGNIVGAVVLRGPGGAPAVAVPANSGSGIVVSGDDNTIGGLAPGRLNLILGNGRATNPFGGGEAGLALRRAARNAVIGNYFGYSFDSFPGGVPQGLRNRTGVLIIDPSTGNTVVDNTIVDSDTGGLLIWSADAMTPFPGAVGDVRVAGEARRVVVSGNFIGTNAAGRASLGNRGPGIHVRGVPGVVIGGAGAGGGNVIAGNAGPGVWVEDDTSPPAPASAFGPIIRGNLIGVTVPGSALGNGGAGVRIGTLGATVGGTGPGEANVIARNAGAGVLVEPTTVPAPAGAGAFTGNVIRGNSIYANIGLGIDLGGDGVSPNDAGDSDAGANGLQNFPLITSATVAGEQVTVAGTFAGRASEGVTLDFYTSPAADPSGSGEGRRHLGSAAVTTDASGDAAFSVVLPAPPLGEPWVTATATSPTGATSEFSLARVIPAPYGAVVARHVFYNRSAADGNDASANAGDDDAIAWYKSALLPGQSAKFANVSTYYRGINGVMIDLGGLGPDATPAPEDFLLHAGNGGTWVAAPPAAVTLRRGAGAYGADRITLVLPDGAVVNSWLRVTVLAGERTGLAFPDVFYFGNLVGESGGPDALVVNATDVARTRAAFGARDAATLDRYDFNRDGAVNATDVFLSRGSQRRTLALFTAPIAAVSTAAAFGDRPIATAAPRSPVRPSHRGVLDAAETGLLA